VNSVAVNTTNAVANAFNVTTNYIGSSLNTTTSFVNNAFSVTTNYIGSSLSTTTNWVNSIAVTNNYGSALTLGTNLTVAGSLTVSNGVTISNGATVNGNVQMSGLTISISSEIPVVGGESTATGTISNTSSSWYCNLTTTTVFVVDDTFSATNGDISIGINISGTNAFSFSTHFTQIYTNAAVTNQINHYVAYLGWGETTNGGFLLSGSHHK
jgi:hypothetical protein